MKGGMIGEGIAGTVSSDLDLVKPVSTYMINGMDSFLVFEHKNLVFQVFSWYINVCFNWSILGTSCLGDGESFACLRDLTVIVVQAEVREHGSEANWVPGCTRLRLSKVKEVHQWYKERMFISLPSGLCSARLFPLRWVMATLIGY